MASNRYEKMYLISEQEYNLRIIQPKVEMPTYKTPQLRAEERDFKALGGGEEIENTANQLYREVLKFSRVNDRNNWYLTREDTLPIEGTNIIDLIAYAVKPGIVEKPYGWSTFLEFLKTHKSIPRVLLTKKVREELLDAPTVPLGGIEPLKKEAEEPPPTRRVITTRKRAAAVIKSESDDMQTGKGLRTYFF